MIRDPRNPEQDFMMPSGGSCHRMHGDMRKTLVLLAWHGAYFVVEGVSSWPRTLPFGFIRIGWKEP